MLEAMVLKETFSQKDCVLPPDVPWGGSRHGQIGSLTMDSR